MKTRRAGGRRPQTATHTISFRLDDRALQRLEKEAVPYRMSLHAYARQVVLEVLDDTNRDRVREEIEELREEMAQLREDLAGVLEMILVNLTAADQDEVVEWVSRNLRRGFADEED